MNVRGTSLCLQVAACPLQPAIPPLQLRAAGTSIVQRPDFGGAGERWPKPIAYERLRRQ